MFVLIVSFKKLVLNHNTIVLNVPDLKPHGPQDQDPDPDQHNIPLFSDRERVAGSEAGWGAADDSSAQMSAVSKEQLVNMVSKMRARYHKYKGRYTCLLYTSPSPRD